MPQTPITATLTAGSATVLCAVGDDLSGLAVPATLLAQDAQTALPITSFTAPAAGGRWQLQLAANYAGASATLPARIHTQFTAAGTPILDVGDTGTRPLINALVTALEGRMAAIDVVPNIYVPSYAREVYLACDRNDAQAGNGRLHNPFNASSADQLLARLNALPADCAVHLLPGVFAHYGFLSTRTGGNYHQLPNAAFRLIGAGMYHSTLKLVGITPDSKGALLQGGGKQASLEIGDLTLDCNVQSAPALGALNLAGLSPECRRGLVHRVRVINWGSNSNIGSGECFPISLACYGGAGEGTDQDPSDLVISSCRVEPAQVPNTYSSDIGVIANRATAKIIDNTVVGGNGGSVSDNQINCALNAAGDLTGLIVTGNETVNCYQGFHLDTAQSVNARGFNISHNRFERTRDKVMLFVNTHDITVAHNRSTAFPGAYMTALSLVHNIQRCLFEGNVIDMDAAVDGALIDTRGGGGTPDPTNVGNVFRGNFFSSQTASGTGLFAFLDGTVNLLQNNRDLVGAPNPRLPDSTTAGPAAPTVIEIPEQDPAYTRTRRWVLTTYHDSLLLQLRDGSGAYLGNIFLQPDGTFRSEVPLTLGTFDQPLAGLTTPTMRIKGGTLPTSGVSGELRCDGSHLYCWIDGAGWKQLDNAA